MLLSFDSDDWFGRSYHYDRNGCYYDVDYYDDPFGAV